MLFAPASSLAQSKARELNNAGWKLIQSGERRSRGAGVRRGAHARARPASAAARGRGRRAPAGTQQGRQRSTEARTRARSASHTASILLGQIAYTDGDVARPRLRSTRRRLTHAPNEPHSDDEAQGVARRRRGQPRIHRATVRSLPRQFPGSCRQAAGRARDRDPRVRVLADRESARHLSVRAGRRHAVHRTAVSRRDAGADVGGRRV